MVDRSKEHMQRLITRLYGSRVLQCSEGGYLIDWVEAQVLGVSTVKPEDLPKEFQKLELLLGEAQRIVCDERVNRQIESNLRVKFGDKIADVDYATLVEEYNNFARSDWFGNEDERFLEWLGKEPRRQD
jgi:hypothetical protein